MGASLSPEIGIGGRGLGFLLLASTGTFFPHFDWRQYEGKDERFQVLGEPRIGSQSNTLF